jgi:high-affinity iron transporter
MFAAAIIVFREVLEAALIVSVILAATRGVHHRLKFIGSGILAGILGSFLVAFSTQALASALDGNGQEIFNAAVLFTVVGLLTWHVVWMQRHGKEMVCEMREVGAAVSTGRASLMVLAVVVMFAVLREGSEIVLFMYGMMASSPLVDVASGLGLGLISGMAAGGVIYWGFVKMPVGKLFSSTNFLLMLIAGGMAARGANKLIQAGYLPSLQDPLWDTSEILSEHSLVGQFLSALVGYMEQPSGMQLLFYVITVGGIAMLGFAQKKKKIEPVKAQS